MNPPKYLEAVSATSSSSPEIIDNQNVSVQINGAKQSKIVITNVNINKVHPQSQQDNHNTNLSNYTILPAFDHVEYDDKVDLDNMDQYNPKIYKVITLNALEQHEDLPSYDELTTTVTTIQNISDKASITLDSTLPAPATHPNSKEPKCRRLAPFLVSFTILMGLLFISHRSC
ncbi:BA75_03648T0 [Komagataella pastoris]|uniref:BA75_03648T0 n=1 Tax=Komagataella pastoris TaxID=4922 RepID=A0A1B2JGC0_PICPA|nr:BA75_03648T0 [Komagataella pastoris]